MPDPGRVTRPASSRLLWAEEIRTGDEYDLGSFAISAEQITDFAAMWDPLPLHLSEAEAGETSFHRLIASGVQTLGVFQRLAVLSVFSRWNIFAGRRLDDVRFLAPVFPGDRLSGGMRVESIEFNHPGRALVTCAGWLERDGPRVLELITESYVNRR